MTEVSGLSAADARIIRNDARQLREQRDQRGQQLNLERQVEVDRQDRDAPALRPPLTPRAPINVELTVEERRAAEARLNLEAPESAFAATAPVGIFGPDGAAVFEPPDEGFSLTDQEVFLLNERQRSQRLAERRDSEQNQQSRQEPRLRIAEQRIAATPTNPDLPRGSLVDVLG